MCPSFDPERPHSTVYRYADPAELQLQRLYRQDGQFYDANTLLPIDYEDDISRKQRQERNGHAVWKEKGEEAPAPSPILSKSKYNCPKCGRYIRQGMHMHSKHCKG